MKKYICIEGIIGSGKTTVTEQLHNYFIQKNVNVCSVYEQFQKNKLLELFYLYPEKYNVLTEYKFLTDRFHQLYQHFQTFKEGIIFSDYCFRKCLWFAENNLNTTQFEEYQQHFLLLEKELNYHPDLIIFLDVQPHQAFKNIQKRNRLMEKNITIDYLENLYNTYKKNLQEHFSPVVFLSVNDYSDVLKDILKLI